MSAFDTMSHEDPPASSSANPTEAKPTTSASDAPVYVAALLHEEFEALKALLTQGKEGTVTSRDGKKHKVSLIDGKIYREDGVEVIDYCEFTKESTKLASSDYMRLVAAYGLPVQVGNLHIFRGRGGCIAAVYRYGE